MTASIDYLHYNPVAPKLVKEIGRWRWSSARWYLSNRAIVDPAPPTIHGPLAELYTS